MTSPKGAVIRDFIEVLSRRFPGVHIRLFPAQVQGVGLSRRGLPGGLYFGGKAAGPDVLVVARGGGSLEDLWTFNEEAVARAIAARGIPVISAIGHRTDVTIADFIADKRAPTPSAAAEMIVCERREVFDLPALKSQARTGGTDALSRCSTCRGGFTRKAAGSRRMPLCIAHLRAVHSA